MLEMKDDPPPLIVLAALAEVIPAVAIVAVTARVAANVRRSFIVKFPPGLIVFPRKNLRGAYGAKTAFV